MNPRLALLAWAFMFVVAAYGLYRVKYQVYALHAEIASAERTLEQEREDLRVAAAEWAYLTRPDRLERLSAKYLRLQPMQPAQVAEMRGVDTRLQALRGSPAGTLVPAAAHLPGDDE